MNLDEQKVNEFLDGIDSEITTNRRERKWEDRAESWLQWRTGQKTGRGNPIFAANILGNLVDRKVALLTQAKPEIRASARKPDLGESSEVLTNTSRAILDQNNFDALVERAGDLACTFGYVGFNTAWDPNADFGQGDIVISALDPRLVAFDERIKSTLDMPSAMYIRIRRPMALLDVRRIWKARGALVKPDESVSSYRSDFAPVSDPYAKRPLRTSSLRSSAYPYTWVDEYWVRDDQRGDDGEYLFPDGRVIHRGTGGIVLDDGPNPYWDGGWPTDIWDWRLDPDSALGRSDVAELQKLQETYQRLGNSIAQNTLLSAVLTIVADVNALDPEQWKLLDNRAARIIKKKPGKEFKFEIIPTFPQELLTYWQSLPEIMQILIGVPDILQGATQGEKGVGAVEGLMVAAESLVRSCARRLEYVVERVGQKLLSRIIQFYTSDRVLIANLPSEGWMQYTFERAKLIDPAIDFDQTKIEERKRYFSNFRFKVTPLSTLPVNRIQRALLAREFYALGVLDEEEILKQAEYPNWQMILARVLEAKRKAAEAKKEEMMFAAVTGTKPASEGGGPASRPRTNSKGTSLGFGR